MSQTLIILDTLSTSLIMRRRLTVWIWGSYEKFFDITVYMKRSSTSYGIHTTNYTAKWFMEDEWQMHSKWGQEIDKATYSLLSSFLWRSTGLWRSRSLSESMELDDLNFAHNLTLLSYTHEQMQMKTTSVAVDSGIVDLNIQKGNTNIFKYNIEKTNARARDQRSWVRIPRGVIENAHCLGVAQ